MQLDTFTKKNIKPIQNIQLTHGVISDIIKT